MGKRTCEKSAIGSPKRWPLEELTMFKYLSIGFVYGLGLSLIALDAAAAGDGTYIPEAMASAPLGILGVPFGVLGAPILWAVAGYLCWRAVRGKSAIPFVALMCLHYATGLVLAFYPDSPYSDMDHMRKLLKAGMTPLLVGGLIVYGLGQVCLWALFLSGRVSQKSAV